MQLLGHLLEEFFTILRGAYLAMLFSPAIAFAPLCITFGYRRASWVRVCPCSLYLLQGDCIFMPHSVQV